MCLTSVTSRVHRSRAKGYKLMTADGKLLFQKLPKMLANRKHRKFPKVGSTLSVTDYGNIIPTIIHTSYANNEIPEQYESGIHIFSRLDDAKFYRKYLFRLDVKFKEKDIVIWRVYAKDVICEGTESISMWRFPKILKVKVVREIKFIERINNQ